MLSHDNMEIITFEIKEKEYKLPTFLSIEEYVKIYNIKDYLGEQYFQAKLINQFTGANMEDILLVGFLQINFISNHLISLFPDTTYPFFDRFTLNGIDYGFIPSLKGMSFAEFVDLDTLMTKKPEEVINNLHIICSIMYRPITKSISEHNFEIEPYNPKTMVQRAELFKKELDIKYVLGANFFFSNFVKNYLNYIPPSLIQRSRNFIRKMVLTWKMRKIIWKILLNKHSDGSQLSTEFVRMTLQSIMPSSKPPFYKRLINSFIFWKKKNI